MGGVDRVAGSLQCEIGLDRRADIESATVKQGPAAVGTLGRADVSRDARLQFGLNMAGVVLKQNELRRDRHIRFALENPMSVGGLERNQRLAGSDDRLVQFRTAAAEGRQCSCGRSYSV